MLRVLILLSVLIHPVAMAAPACREFRELTDLELEELRFNLERLYYGSDLLIRNRAADENDFQRLKRQAEYLRLFERIPFKTADDDLKKELQKSAESAKLKLVRLRVNRQKASKKARLPKSILADNVKFHLSDAQLTKQLLLEIEVEGQGENVERWTRTWGRKLVRWLEPLEIRAVGKKGTLWKVSARAYEFREIRFPKMTQRDPRSLFPECGKIPPRLLKWVQKIREIAPRAAPEYEKRREHLLLEQRLSFFIAKSLRSPVK